MANTISEVMTQGKKVAVITGVTGGIGSSFAQHLAQQQYDLIISAYERELLEQIASDLRRQYNIEVTTVLANLAVAEEVSSFTEKLEQAEQLDMLVNCAGFGENNLFYEEDINAIRKMLSVHISATVELVHAVLPLMIRQQSGSIITVSSLAAFMPAPGSSIYASTKAFLNSFMESIHMEVDELGIKVQSLCPGLTHTKFHDSSDVERSINIKGIDLWMDADEVVRFSLEGLKKKEVICVPGCINQAIRNFSPAMPRRLYYALADKAAEKFRK